MLEKGVRLSLSPFFFFFAFSVGESIFEAVLNR